MKPGDRERLNSLYRRFGNASLFFWTKDLEVSRKTLKTFVELGILHRGEKNHGFRFSDIARTALGKRKAR